MRRFMLDQRLPLLFASVYSIAACDGGAANRAADSIATPANSSGANADTAAITLTAAQVKHGGVRWELAESREVSGRIELPGQLVPNEDRTVRLGAPAQGRVMAVHIRPGERVTSGQPLITLQSEAASAAAADDEKARSELASRRAAATYARTARERADRLLAIKAGSHLYTRS